MISDRLFSLPIAALTPGPDVNGKDTSTERNLPRRNILRASEPTPLLTGSVGLATGEEAEHYAQQRIPGLYDATAQVRALLAARLSSQGFDPNYLSPLTPLWLFVLAEAETTEGKQRLGQLGSHIVAEFPLGSLRCDEGSVLYAAPANLQGWGPTATIAANRRYSMPDLLAYLQADAKVGGRSTACSATSQAAARCTAASSRIIAAPLSVIMIAGALVLPMVTVAGIQQMEEYLNVKAVWIRAA